MIDQTIGHYEIIERLGEGGMGVVYKARDSHLDRFVAIKVLPPDKVADPDRRRRFVQEAKAASALNHPNIVHIYDISSEHGLDFIAMELVEGKTLERLIPRRGLPLGEVLSYATQAADALAKAHAAGIVHRDLKPSNIVISERGLVKILDFGLAKLLEPTESDARSTATTATVSGRPLTEEGRIVGTAAYMSPEQAEGKKLDARSDIFSFGSVLYEMATGARAFGGDSSASSLAAVIAKDPKPPSQIVAGLPRDLERLILRCLRKDATRRFQTMADLKVALEDVKIESDARASAVQGLAGAWRGRRWLQAASVGLLLIGAAGWFAWHRLHPRLPAPRVEALTSLEGSEWSPSFSPDGRQVAFHWNGGKRNNFDIYVKVVGSPEALRLTTDAAADLAPAWSPDGRLIAFARSRAGIFLVSPLGGAERRLLEMRTGPPSWSPDGRWIALTRWSSASDPLGGGEILLVPTGGGEPRQVSSPRRPALDRLPVFSPDGRRLAYFSCTGLYTCDLAVLPLREDLGPAGAPRRQPLGLNPSGLAWSRDGKTIVYAASPTLDYVSSHLWRASVDGSGPPQRLEIAGSRAKTPAIAPSGDRLAFTRETSDADIWRHTLDGKPESFLSSSWHDGFARFSPDGRHVAFHSARNGETLEIWIADADGGNPRQLTRDVGRMQSAPSWSPDRRWIAFCATQEEGQNIWVIDVDGARARRLTTLPGDEMRPSFSHDGRWVYFDTRQAGRPEIWRVAFVGGVAEQVTREGGCAARESPDGRYLVYTNEWYGPLFVRPVEGGPVRQVIDRVAGFAFDVVPDGIYYLVERQGDGMLGLRFYDLASGKSRSLIEIGRSGHAQFLSVSPDRKTLLSPRFTLGSDLMLIENFR